MSSRSVLFLSLFLLFTVTSSHAGDWGKVSDVEWSASAPAEMSDAGVINLFVRAKVSVNLDRRVTSIHVRIKVLTSAGGELAGDVNIEYLERETLSRLDAQTILPNGKKIKVDSKQIFSKESGDTRAKAFSFPSVESGCILEYRYELSNSKSFYIRPWYFQSGFYTIESQMALQLAPGFTFSNSAYYMSNEDQTPKIEKSLNVDYPGLYEMTYTWTMRNLKPADDEPYMGLAVNFLPAMHFELATYEYGNAKQNFLKDWGQIGLGNQTLIERYSPTSALRQLADRLAGSSNDPVELASRFHRWVADSVALDNSSVYWNPNDGVDPILQKRVATDKEKNLLLWGLLQARKIKSFPVWISTRNHVLFNPKIVTESQFDHIITMVDLDSAFFLMDASDRHAPFGTLPPNCLVSHGLIQDGSKSEPIEIPLPQEMSVRQDSLAIIIDTAGSLKCKIHSRMGGYFVPYYSSWLDEQSIDKAIASLYETALGNDTKVENGLISKDSLGMLNVSFTVTLPDRVRSVEPELLVQLPSLVFATNPFTKPNRSYPLDFNFPRRYVTVVTAELPSGYSIATLPEKSSIEKPGLRFDSAFELRGNQLIYGSGLDISRSIYARERYPDFKQIFAAVASQLRQDIVLMPAK